MSARDENLQKMILLLALLVPTAISVLVSLVLDLTIKRLPWGETKGAKILYLVFLLLSAIISLFLRPIHQSKYGLMIFGNVTVNGLPCEGECLDFVMKYKVMLGVAFTHLVYGLMLYRVNDTFNKRSIIHEGLWPVKGIFLVLAVSSLFYLPNNCLRALAYTGLVGASLSILIKIVFMINSAYDYTIYLVDKYEETNSAFYKYLLIFSTFALNTLTIGFSVFDLTKFSTSVWPVYINLILVISMIGSSVTPKVQEKNPRVGLFQASIISAYNAFLIHSAVSSIPLNSEIAPPSLINPFFTFSLSIFLVALSAYNIGKVSIQGCSSDSDKDGETDDKYNRSFFHFMFLVSAFEVAVVLTGWQIISVTKTEISIISNYPAFWAKVLTSWGTFLLYMWSVIAPLVLTDRTFS